MYNIQTRGGKGNRQREPGAKWYYAGDEVIQIKGHGNWRASTVRPSYTNYIHCIMPTLYSTPIPHSRNAPPSCLSHLTPFKLRDQRKRVLLQHQTPQLSLARDISPPPPAMEIEPSVQTAQQANPSSAPQDRRPRPRCLSPPHTVSSLHLVYTPHRKQRWELHSPPSYPHPNSPRCRRLSPEPNQVSKPSYHGSIPVPQGSVFGRCSRETSSSARFTPQWSEGRLIPIGK